ncbi:MAG: peptidoglycan-binding protein LysM [Sulfurovum sp.]|nr:MAG: peptidoglycan-binding protein LysM [Sulfurovum sp.]RUM70877.1 MAG: peptidoglycan-binding protein LysM [Sulfurovum sp.]RUM74371.1 MAG: peptidoglycan-binding protein LysM [Sulfurovum sp.]
MGFFDFLSSAGKKILGTDDDAGAIKEEIESSFKELPVQGLVVEVDGDTVSLGGVATDTATKEKAILIAGNVEGISKVNADQLVTMDQIASENTRDAFNPVFYTIQKGDTLWGIASDFYKDGSKYPLIVEANKEVIKDADLIYPGQAIRIPELVA